MNRLKEITECIIEAADELLSKGRDNLDLVEQGQLIAYAESLTIIQDVLSDRELAAVALDFDIDAKYLM